VPKEPAKVTPEEKGSEYDRFKNLTNKLVKVPKAEIDAERKKADEAKKAKG
jgi:hypothetical protein